ncbi:MAG: kelch repeat-containing protein [Planctomycetota bacterium]
MTHWKMTQETVLFGGLVPFAVATNETWVYANGEWTQRFPSVVPPPRYGHAMASSSLGVLMHGGLDFNHRPLRDTWLWDGTNWSQQQDGPRRRAGHVMFTNPADPASCIYMHGGFGFGDTYDDNWMWDGAQWVGGYFGPQRTFHAVTSTGVMFGGQRYVGGLVTTFNDLLQFNFQNGLWCPIPATNPPSPRFDHVLEWNDAISKIVLYGGRDPSQAPINETWEFDGAAWVQSTPLGAPPAGVGGARMVSNQSIGGTTLFGGATAAGAVNSHYEYGTDNLASFLSVGVGCAGSNGATPTIGLSNVPYENESFTVPIAGFLPGAPLSLMIGDTPFDTCPTLPQLCPVDMGPAGAPGCSLYVDTNSGVSTTLSLTADASGAASLSLPIPAATQGVVNYYQVVGIDLAGNPLGLTFSNLRVAAIGARGL